MVKTEVRTRLSELNSSRSIWGFMGQLLVVTHVHKGPLDQVVGSSRHQQGENGGTVTQVANVEHIYDLAGQGVIEIERVGKMRRHSHEASAADGP